MLNINPDTICYLVGKAREFHVKEEVVIPEEPDSPSDDWARQVLADHSGDLTYQDAASVVEDLEPDQQIALVALMWLGRGDYDLADWESALIDAADAHSSHTAAYLLSTPLMADYLEEGLSQHGYSCQLEKEFVNVGIRSG